MIASCIQSSHKKRYRNPDNAKNKTPPADIDHSGLQVHQHIHGAYGLNHQRAAGCASVCQNTTLGTATNKQDSYAESEIGWL